MVTTTFKRKRQIPVALDPDQLEAVKKLAREERLSISAVVRRAIDAYIGKR